MVIAEKLQLKGLMGKTDEKTQDFEEDEKPVTETFSPAIFSNPNMRTNFVQTVIPNGKTHKPGETRILAVPNKFSGDLVELEERVKSMMEKSQNKNAYGRHLTHLRKTRTVT